MSRKIRWGILGTADIGRRVLIPAIQNSSNSEVVAIASRSMDKCKQVAEEQGILKVYGNYSDLLADPEIDAVYNPLPNNLHAPWTISAIEHNKHVLCEKPLAVKPEEVDLIKRAADQHSVFVMEAVMFHFHPQTKRVMEIIREGNIGVPQIISSAFTYHLPNPDDIRLKSELGGGVLLDVGSYCVSVARMIFGKEPVNVFGSARFGPTSDVDELFAGILAFSDGAQSCFSCCLHGPRDQWYRVTGTEASLFVPVPFAPGIDNRSIILRRGWQRGKETEEIIEIPGIDQYQLMVEHFCDCINSNREPVLSLNESKANLVIVDALMKSAKERIPINII